MRMRKKKHASARLEECGGILAKEPCANRGRWSELFGNDHPIHIEIGCGKGGFIAGMAAKNPGINYVAIEKITDVLVIAAEKVKAEELENVRVFAGNAELLTDIFSPGEAARIYLNFSDPWPKSKHDKRRLTYKSFLELYKNVLAPGGEIHFKTDNRGLFEFSLNSFCENDFRLKNITLDLHNSKFEGNIMTEYEKRFSDMGQPIYRLEAASCCAK